MNYAEKLTSELLHTPRRQWAETIKWRVFEAQAACHCYYCGHVTDLSHLTVEQQQKALLSHRQARN